MKKIFYILVILLSTVILVSCINLTHEEIFNNIEIIYSEDDDKNNITDDFEFNYELNDKYEIDFETTSNAITINDNKYVVVTRSEEDQTAIVEVNIRYKGETVVFEYTFTILKLEHVVEEEVVVKFIVDDKTYQEVTILKEQKVEKPIDPTKEGFNFLGWFLNEELFDFDQIVSSNLKLTAKWEEIIEEDKLIFRVDINDFIHTIGDEVIEYVEVSGWLNEIDVKDLIEVNDDQVDFNKPGTYEIIYSVEYENETYEKKVLVTVVEKVTLPPTITNTKDFIYFIGEDKPNYLEGVTAVDFKGDSIEVVVDDSKVIYDLEGTYNITFTAIDSNDKTTIVTKTVTVESLEGGVLETFTEDFSNLNLSGSSYVDGTFIGINNIKWTYTKSRGDQTLDGKALTFQNNQNNHLSATLPNGISYFSIDAINVFGGGTTREFALYINNELVETFYSKGDKETFVVKNLNYKGEVLLEIKNTGKERITIDNIIIGVDNKTPEEKYLDFQTEQLTIKQIFLQNSNIEFVNSLADIAINWKFKDNNNEFNSLINFETGSIVIPEDDKQVRVTITAILTYESYETTKDFVLTIGEGEPITISAVRNSTNNSQIKTKGVITHATKLNDIYYGFIEDSNSGIYFESRLDSNIETGMEVIIKGYKDTLNNNSYIKDIYSVNVIGTKSVSPFLSNINDTTKHLGRYVTIEAYVKADITNTRNFVITNGTKSLNIVTPTFRNEISRLENTKLGQTILLDGFIYNENTIYLMGEENLLIDNINEAEIEALIIDALTLPSGSVNGDLELPTKDLVFNLDIEWMSNNESIISDEGKYNKPEKDTFVTLTYQIVVNNSYTITKTITLEAKAVEPLLPYYKSVEGLTGNSLLLGLRNIISSYTHKSYDDAKSILIEADRDLNKPGNIYLIYDGDSIKGVWDSAATWNREHVWPQSKLAGASKSDLHNLRASEPKINSSRGNLPFIDGNGKARKISSGWYPGDEHKGDIARIIFYMLTRYSQLSVNTMGTNAEMFVRWHLEDPVDDFERNRNEVIYTYQKNRNPYIDNPEFVEMIWGTVSNRRNVIREIIVDVIVNQELYILNDKREYVM